MKKIIIGGLAILIGVSGFSNFFFTFLALISGALPILLILGGALAFYLGYTDIQTEKDTQPADWAPLTMPVEEVVEEPETDITDPAPAEDTAPDETTLDSASPAFKGNATTLVFHSVDCKFSQGKKCTVDFVSREEAIDQGYKPCKVCKA